MLLTVSYRDDNTHRKLIDLHSMTSGARYHLVATYSVMNPCPPSDVPGGGLADDRARPKSQICKAELERGKRFVKYGMDGLYARA